MTKFLLEITYYQGCLYAPFLLGRYRGGHFSEWGCWAGFVHIYVILCTTRESCCWAETAILGRSPVVKSAVAAKPLVSRSLFHAILEKIHRLKPVSIGYD
jgi:hypothetical protein